MIGVIWHLIVFTTLKLMGEITWSWVWVVSPIWVPCVIVVAAVGWIQLATYFCSLFEDTE